MTSFLTTRSAFSLKLVKNASLGTWPGRLKLMSTLTDARLYSGNRLLHVKTESRVSVLLLEVAVE
jgi:hypothetical protein